MALSSKAIYPLLNYRKALLDHNKILMLYTSRFQSNKTTEKSLRPQSNKQSQISTSRVTAKAGQAAKTVSYMGVILLGVGVTGTLFYAVFNELFSSKSSNNIYTKAAKKCIENTQIQDLLGLPITSYGEETRRGRRQHVNHVTYEKNGVKHLRMKFYLQGNFNKGVVSLDMQEAPSGKYEYRYLLVQVNDIRQTTVVLEDNRENLDNTSTNANTLLLSS